MLPVGKHDTGERHATLVLHSVADDRERFLARLGHDVVGTFVVALVDIFFRDELVDVDCVGILELDGVDLIGLDLDVLALRQLVSPPLVVGVHGASGFFIHHLRNALMGHTVA